MEVLQGKTALVTGASSGLGADFARELAGRGCGLILAARRTDRLEKLRAEIAARHGVPVECLPADLTEPGGPRRLYDRIRSGGRSVDLLVNNAGFGLYGEFLSTPWDRLRDMLELDIMALTELTRLFGADMRERRAGFMLLVASTASFQPTPLYAAYAAAKSYVLCLGEALRFELRRSGVGCTVLCPGVTRTEFLEISGQTPTLYQRLTMMESSEVARIGIAAMLKGRACVTAGLLNAFMAWSTRFLPRQALASAAWRLMKSE